MPAIITLLGGIRATVFACLFLAAIAVLGVQSARWEHRNAVCLAQKLATSRAATQAIAQQREIEQRHAAAFAAIGEQHERDRAAAQAVEADVVNGLRHGTVRLHEAWCRCEQLLSQASTAPSERDASTGDRAALAAAVIRAGREADDRIRACQEVIRVQISD